MFKDTTGSTPACKAGLLFLSAVALLASHILARKVRFRDSFP